jgi:hypothetical protein
MGKNNPPQSPRFAVAFFSAHQETVISTETAHGLIVSRAVEKSAFLLQTEAVRRRQQRLKKLILQIQPKNRMSSPETT